MAWNVVFREPAREWYRQLGQRDRIEIGKTIRAIRESGPGLRRPLVGTIAGSRHHNMREARSVGGHPRWSAGAGAGFEDEQVLLLREPEVGDRPDGAPTS